MKKILVTLGLIISLISNAQVLSVPIGGTYPKYPITNTLEYRGANGSTFFVDTLKSFEFGYGNRKNLRLATIKSSILCGNNNLVINNNNLNAQSYIQMQPDAFIYVSNGNGTSVTDSTLISFDPAGISISGNDSVLFKGVSLANLGTTNKDIMLYIINKNKDAYTYLPKQISDSLYLAITSNITINGVTKNLKTNPTFTISGGGGTTSVTATSPLSVTSGTAIALNYGTGLSVSSGSLINSSPNQTVTLTGAGTTTVTGTYPTFTISGGGGGSNYSFTTPLVSTGTVVSIPSSNSATNGYLTSADWITFNGKQNTLTAGTGIAISGNTISATGGSINTGTVNQVAVYSGTNTVGGNNNLQFDGTNLSLGGTTTGAYPGKFRINSMSSGQNVSLYNPNTSQYGGIIFEEDAANYGVLYRYNSTFPGTYAGTSLPLANSFNFQSGSGNDKLFAISSTPFVITPGTSSSNQNSRHDAVGLRIDIAANIHTTNLNAFTVNGKTYLGGNTTATAYNHIAGSASGAVGTASLKLDAGTLLTTIENNAIENDGTHVYYSSGGVRYTLDRQTGNTPTVKNSTSLLSLTTATTVSTYTTASGGMFEVAGFITVNAIATNVINFQVTFTDTHGLKTVTYPSVSTTGYNSDAKATFVAIAGSVITVSTILTTSIGTINYDVGATIIKVQ